jgi:glyoxylase-like metal-dependent hydrolase (beta-lactamase superfamily II)
VREVADGVFMLRGFPPAAINVYLAGDVLVDAGTRWARRRILRELRGREVRAHALTHAHADHQGASHAVCTELGLPLWAGERDAEVVEDPSLLEQRMPASGIVRLQRRFWLGPAHPVERRLREGDEVAGFAVIDVPGHSAGHIALWRERDRLLITGDVVTTMNVRTGRRGLHEPLPMFTPDVPANRGSIRRIAALRPAVTLVGHGAPWRDPEALSRFASSLD